MRMNRHMFMTAVINREYIRNVLVSYVKVLLRLVKVPKSGII